MISVLIPVYNGSEYVLDQLESIRTQTLPVDEVILCDDGSADGTPHIVQAYVDRYSLDGWQLHLAPMNLGPAGNSLHLLQYAKGDLVFMADQDDVWEPHKVSTMVDHLNRHPSVIAVTSTETLIDQHGDDISETPIAKHFGENVVPFGGWRALGVRDFLGYSSSPWHAMCVRKQVVATVLEAGAPDARRTLGADWYVGLIASLLGDFHMLGTPLMRRRVHSSNASLGRLRRTTLLATHLERRIQLLEEVRIAHEHVLSSPGLQPLLTPETRDDLRRFIAMQEARARFTRSPHPMAALSVISKLRTYRSTYGGWGPARRALGADILYASRLARNTRA